MYWNYRVLEKIEGEGTPYEETFLYIVEVFYNYEDDNIIGWQEEDANLMGSTVENLRTTLDWMRDALDKPILIAADLLQRMEELTAMGVEVQDIGVPENGEIGLGDDRG